MHNFCGTAFVRYGSVLITMRRRALHISQHRLLCGTNIAHNSAFREHFERCEKWLPNDAPPQAPGNRTTTVKHTLGHRNCNGNRIYKA